MTTQEAWEKQAKRLEWYKNHQPDLLVKKQARSEQERLKEIGINNLPLNKPLGYIRLYPEDFIVEEIMADGQISKINNLEINAASINQANGHTLYCRLIKINIPTSVAIEKISEYLDIAQNKIGHAGLKDSEAITAQLIAFSNIKIPATKIMETKIPNVYLSGFYYGQGTLTPGDLKANKFTLTIRTKEPLDKKFEAKIETIKEFGILNYYQSQRFGGLRLLSHKLGQLIMQGQYETAIKKFLLENVIDDIPLIAQLREEAEKIYPDWSKIKQIYEELPYTFFNEIRLLNYLITSPNNYIGGLIAIQEQTQLWVYAYSSRLFNQYLSDYTKVNGCTDEKFPLLLSDKPEDGQIYYEYLKADQTLDFIKHLKPFKFIHFKTRLLSGRIFPQEINYKNFDRGVIISFILPKGCYATTFMANIFELVQGLPLPDWVSTGKIDPLEIMKRGSLNELKQIFKNYWISKLDSII